MYNSHPHFWCSILGQKYLQGGRVICTNYFHPLKHNIVLCSDLNKILPAAQNCTKPKSFDQIRTKLSPIFIEKVLSMNLVHDASCALCARRISPKRCVLHTVDMVCIVHVQNSIHAVVCHQPRYPRFSFRLWLFMWNEYTHCPQARR